MIVNNLARFAGPRIAAVVLCFTVAIPATGQAPTSNTLKLPYPDMSAILRDEKEPGRNAEATDEQIAGWVRDLDSNRFAERKRASTELSHVGSRAIPSLLDSMRRVDSLELQVRGFRLLEQMTVCEDIPSESAAYQALLTLVADKRRQVQGQANEVLLKAQYEYKVRAIKRLKSLGAKDYSAYDYGQTVQGVPRGQLNGLTIDDDWQGKPGDIRILPFVIGIQNVRLIGEKITDEFVEAVAECDSLARLDILRANITDDGFAKLSGSNLVVLNVRYTPITEKSLPTIATLKKAKGVFLFGTNIRPKEADPLAAKLPSAIKVDIRSGGFLGISPLNQFQPNPNECIISRPIVNSAAERAGLIQDDVILKYGGKPVRNFDDLKNFIGENKPGDEIKVTIRRAASEKELTIKLREWPDNEPPIR